MKSTKNKYYSFLLISLLVLSAIFTGCSHKNKTVETTTTNNENIVTLTDAQIKNAHIQSAEMKEQAISTQLKLTGKIDVPPQNLVSISFPLGGYLKNTKLLPGMHIQKGEIIAVMEDQSYIQLQQEYLLTKSKLYFAEKEYARQLNLNKNQASSDKVTEQAESEVKNNKILLSAYAEKLKLININPSTLSESNLSKSINIYSPIAGFVSAVNVNIGKYVNPSDVLFELVNPEDIHLGLKVFEKDINKLNIGQKLTANTNANPAKKYICEIILVSKDVSEDGTTDVHCHFETYDKTLLPGMYMNAEVQLMSVLANVLPEESIVNSEAKDYVFIQNDKNIFMLQEVKLGAKENGFVEIINADVLKGKKIVNKGAYTILMKKNNVEE
jgi:cobalt-zinc-cadmium efflux system membrane fusion protein